jgi:hypothetical protein
MNPDAKLELLLKQIDEESDHLASEQEAFDVHTLSELWRTMPLDLKQQLIESAKQLWPIRGALLQRVVATAYSLIIGQGLLPLPALRQAARQLRVPQRGTQGKLSAVQVKQYHRRQEQRGRKPGRNPQIGRRWLRESEVSDQLPADITAEVARLLNLPFSLQNIRGLRWRKQRLAELFKALSPDQADALYNRLKVRRRDDRLSRLFHHRLATATRDELTGILLVRAMGETL